MSFFRVIYAIEQNARFVCLPRLFETWNIWIKVFFAVVLFKNCLFWKNNEQFKLKYLIIFYDEYFEWYLFYGIFEVENHCFKIYCTKNNYFFAYFLNKTKQAMFKLSNTIHFDKMLSAGKRKTMLTLGLLRWKWHGKVIITRYRAVLIKCVYVSVPHVTWLLYKTLKHRPDHLLAAQWML